MSATGARRLSSSFGHATAWALAGAVLLSLGVRIALSARVQGPWIYPDELGYEQVAVNLARGRLALYGKTGLTYSPLYPLTLAPLYAVGLSASHAHEGIKILNSAFMSLALVPVYGIARFMLPRGPAFLVVGLAAIAPLMYFTTLGMSESLAYPLFLVTVWLLLRTLTAPSRLNDGLLLAGIVSTCAVRIQLVALVPAALTALLVLAWDQARSERQPAGRLLNNLARRHVVLVVGGLALGLLAAVPTLTGSNSISVAGRYSNVPGNSSPAIVHTAKLFVYHAAGLVFVAGVIPFVGTLAVALVWLRRRGSARTGAFAATAIGLTFWLLVETAFAVNAFERLGDAPRIHERYLFYLLPLFLTAFVVALWNRGARPSRTAYALAISVALVGVLVIPFQTVINRTIVADSFSFEIFARNGTLQPLPHATTLGLGIVAVLGAITLVLRTNLISVAVVLAFVFVFLSYGEAVRVDAAADGQRRVLGATRDWVDRAHPATSVAMVVGPAVKNALADWQTDYYNLSIRRLYYTCLASLSPDFGERKVSVDADGVFRSGGRELETGYAVVPANLGVEGRVVARNTTARLVLVKTDGGTIRLRANGRWRCQARTNP